MTPNRPTMIRSTVVALGLTLALGSAPAAAQSASGAGSVLRESPLSYLVNTGDTLIDVARKYLRSPDDYRQLQRDNAVANPRRMATGRTLNIDPALLKTRADPALLDSFRGNVRIQRGNATVPADTGLSLQEGDVISTGQGSFVRIAFSDGTRTVVPSQSRLRLDRLRRFVINDAPDHRLVVEQGRVENSVNARQRPGGFRVTTPTAISAVRGTEFRVAYDATSGISATGVLDGAVAVADAADSTSILVPQGQGTAVRPGQGLTAVTLLSPPVMAEASALQTDETVSIDYSAPADTRIVQGFIASDASLQALVAEVQAPNGSPLALDTDLPEGQWFVRLTAISADGLEGRGRTFNFIRARNGIGGLSLSDEMKDNARLFRFQWKAEGEGDASFRFQLTPANDDGEPQGQPLVDAPGLTDPTFTLTNLPSGTYVWRVEGTRHRFGHRLSAWSNPELLTIN